MQRRLIAIGVVLLICVLGFLAFHWMTVGIPLSNVRITSDITWRPYQNKLQVTNLDITILRSNLNLFNNRFLVRYRVSGQIRSETGPWRPFVKQVHLNERLIIPTISNDFRHGEIEIVPLVDVKQDASYTGTPLPFEACIEKVTQTFDWGRNNYIVTCGTIQTNFVVHQRK